MPERLTVSEYLDYLRPFYSRWDRDLEGSIRRQLRLPPERRIGNLSHGMRMKMALACALPFRPELLVLDEPFSGLDPLVRDEFMERLLQQAGEMTVLISSGRTTRSRPALRPVCRHNVSAWAQDATEREVKACILVQV